MTRITSRHHPVVKACRDLAQGRGDALLLDGWHLVAEALAVGLDITTIVFADAESLEAATTLERARHTPARLVEVSEAVMHAASPVRSPTGVVAIAERPLVDPRRLVAPPPALVLALTGVQDPGNVGAAIRSAAAAGATGVTTDGTCADPWGWKALRAGMGSTFRVPVAQQPDLTASLGTWREAGMSVLAAVPEGGQWFHECDLRRPTVVLLGGEGRGLAPSVLACANQRVSIPMRAGIDSLNIAVAAALLLYEARRQRSLGGRRR